MKKIISLALIFGSMLAFFDLTSTEAIHEELIFLFITIHWFWVQKGQVKIPRHIFFSYLFLVSASMHGFFNVYLPSLAMYIRMFTLILFLISLVLLVKNLIKTKNNK